MKSYVVLTGILWKEVGMPMRVRRAVVLEIAQLLRLFHLLVDTISDLIGILGVGTVDHHVIYIPN